MKKPPVDVTHILTAFRLRASVQAFERELTPVAAANALLAYREHANALGLAERRP